MVADTMDRPPPPDSRRRGAPCGRWSRCPRYLGRSMWWPTRWWTWPTRLSKRLGTEQAKAKQSKAKQSYNKLQTSSSGRKKKATSAACGWRRIRTGWLSPCTVPNNTADTCRRASRAAMAGIAIVGILDNSSDGEEQDLLLLLRMSDMGVPKRDPKFLGILFPQSTSGDSNFTSSLLSPFVSS